MFNPVKRLIRSFWIAINWLVLKVFAVPLAHANVCLDQFDPIVDTPRNVRSIQFEFYRQHRANLSKKKHRLFILPFVIVVYVSLNALYYFSMNDFEYDNRRHPIPEIFSHKIFPEKFWNFGDMIILIDMICGSVVYFNLWLSPWLDDKFYMYLRYGEDGTHKLIVNGKVWNQKSSEKIVEFRRKNKRAMKVLMISSCVFGELYFFVHFWAKPITGNVWEHYFQMYIFLFPFIWYCEFCVIMMFYNFFIATRYVMFKQRAVIEMMDRLIAKMQDSTDSGTFSTQWRTFVTINHKLAYQCAEIRGYNRFWSIHLTCQFGSLTIILCYMAYSFLFVKATFDQLVYFSFFGCEIAVIIFAVIYRCSLVDSFNDQCYMRNVKICILFQLHFNVTNRQLTNIETIATNRNFSRCCFRLANGYRLDSTAFNLATYIISTFFLMICRREGRK